MPFYDFKCRCGKVESAYKTVAERNDEPPVCHDEPMRRVLVLPPFVRGDYQGYVSPASGKWVEGKKAHIDDLARSDCRILEQGESAHFAKNAAKIHDESLTKACNEAVDAAVKDLGMG